MGFTHTIPFEIYSVDRQRPLRQTDRQKGELLIIHLGQWVLLRIERDRDRRREEMQKISTAVGDLSWKRTEFKGIEMK